MEKQILNFTANEQILVCENPIKISTNKVNYIQANFDLGQNWTGYDSIRAVWFNDFNCISTVLDSLGNCAVPFEVMKRKGNVKINLVGSISEDDVLTDRLTSYPVVAVIVDCTAQIAGANTQPITPSEFEQFAQRVHTDADRAEQSASNSEASAQASEASAVRSANSATASADSATASANSASESATSATASANSASDSASSASASANSATESHTYAQNASESAVSAENSAQASEASRVASHTAQVASETARGLAEDARDEAVEAKDLVLGMRATAVTLEPDEPAEASYNDGVLTLGIPKGHIGATPAFSIGTVETLEPLEDATASITGTEENPVLNLGIPKGDTGEVSLSELEDATVVQTLSDNEPYHFRRTNGGNGSGHREYDKIVGGAVAWNQLVQNGNFATKSKWTTWRADYAVANNEAIITNTDTNGSVYQDVPCIAGHKYILSANIKNIDATEVLFVTMSSTLASITSTSYVPIQKMVVPAVSGTLRMQFTITGNTGEQGAIKSVQVFDLTQMFGSTIADYIYSLEQSTAGSGVSWLKSHFPKLFDTYQPFDSGSIKSVSGLTAHEMVGKNLFDQDNADWVTGYFINASGVVSANGQYKYTDAYMQVSGSTQYAISCTKTSTANTILSVCFYDSAKTFVERVTAIDYGAQTGRKSGTFTTTAETKYIRFSATYASGDGGTNDFQIEFGSTATDFEPYESHTYTLDSSVTLRGKYKLDANNNLYADGDVWKSDGTLNRNYYECVLDGTISLGGSFLARTNTSRVLFNYSGLPVAMKPNATANAWIVSDFPTYNPDYVYSNDVEGISENKNAVSYGLWVSIANSKLSEQSVAGIQAYLREHPITVVYPRQPPTTESAPTYENPQWCDSKGTEEYVGSELPVGHSTDYPMSLVDTMPTTNGTFEPRITVTNGVRTVTWVSV